jgi:MFS family permease
MNYDNIDIKNKRLTQQQKETVGLLSIGTFLEYFDLMIYVHMVVLLNELFFPKTDPFTSSLLSAFAFCSTYLLRPFGALIFGYIGDHMGRKFVVVMTTFLMGICCTIMAILPTYAQIGISASVIVTICRMVQGMAATAEIRGAEIYLTETSKPPMQYLIVGFLTLFSALGTSAAIGVASIFTNPIIATFTHNSWRVVFGFGAIVALVGFIIRTDLKETEDFAKKKDILNNPETMSSENKKLLKETVPIWTSIYYFFIQCARPPCFYFIYIYCGDVLKNECGFTPSQIINQNFFVSIIDFFGIIILLYLSIRMKPLKILKLKFYLFFSCIIFFPIAMAYNPSSNVVLIFQCLAALFVFDHVPATPLFYKYFSIFKRFTYTSFISAIAKLLTFLITSFGLVFATEYFGYLGIFLIFIPVGVGFFLGVIYFEKMEKFYGKLEI